MKTPEEWAFVFQRRWLDAVNSAERRQLPMADLLALMASVLKDAMAEAAAHAIRNVPPLPTLHVDDARASGMTVTWRTAAGQGDEWKSAWFDSLLRDYEDLHADRETLLRMLADCDGLDAYAEGYKAGKAVAGIPDAEKIIEMMRSLSEKDRESLIGVISNAYCRYCGRAQRECGLRGCQCWNDE